MSEKIVQLNEEIIKGQIKELVRGSVEETLNELLEKEAESLTQAARYERSETRQGYRSGHYDRNLTTTSSDVTLHMPRLKGVSFETVIIERYRRRESSVEEALIEMYLAGVSVRRVEDITEALWGSKVSPATISELNKKAYVHIEDWRNRPLQGGRYPYVYVEAKYQRCTANGSFVFADRSYDVPVLAALCPGASGGKQKSVLTLATVNPSGQTIAQVQEFNRSNSDYQVEILDFSSLLDSGSYMDLFTTWNTAIAAGDTPDMVDFSNLPWYSFADRGMLLDLNTILPQEDILPWLWESVSYHGANYTFPGCFTVETLVGKQLKLGDRQHWTVQEFLALADSSDISMFSGMSRELLLFYMEQYLLDAFLDEETKTCSFDSEEFRSLLDYAATLADPEELGFEVENSMLLIRRDLALAEPVILSNIGQMHSAESYTVGEPLAWIGWPGPNGTKVRPDAEIAVFKNTDHADGAAAFLHFLLSDTSQTVLGRFAFPMTASMFEKEINAAMEPRNTNDPDLATEFTVDGTVYPVVPLSEEDAARYETFFENISAQIYYPWQAANILEAECGALWAGERTAAETAAQIQSRMELYLAEIYS